MKKRLVALLLAGATLSGAITGCGHANETACATQPALVQSFVQSATEASCYEEPATECEAAPAYEGNTGMNSVAAKSAARSTADTESAQSVGGYEYENYDEAAYEDSSICIAPYSNETYEKIQESLFTSVKSNPLSTFGADVDTASYANFRRMVNDGYSLYDIPQGSIRPEEMINYFSYNYKNPKKNQPFGVEATITDCPWNSETKLVTLGIKAREIKDTKKVPSNIVFLVDVSGSMSSYDKLPLLQMAFELLTDDLDKNDRVSIVTYSSGSEIVLAGVPGNQKSKIKKAMNSLVASGSTNGGRGIQNAYKLAEKYFVEGGNNRIIMATDGDLNVGITDPDELEDLISSKKESGVFLSVLGFGTGNYNDVTLETLADKGNGNYSYIDCLSEAKKVLVDEFDSTLFTVAKDVKFQIEFNPAYISEYHQIGYENRQMAAQDFNDDTKDGGEIGSGHTVTVMYEVKLNDKNNRNDDGITYKYQENELTDLALDTDEWMNVSVRYKDPNADESQLLSFPICKDCYTKNPSCDTLFAAYVAQAAMIMNHSEYVDAYELYDVIDNLKELNLDDEYKEEFIDLLEQI